MRLVTAALYHTPTRSYTAALLAGTPGQRTSIGLADRTSTTRGRIRVTLDYVYEREPLTTAVPAGPWVDCDEQRIREGVEPFCDETLA